MRNLDETDMEILSLLAEDARRSFSSIGEKVGLSGPAVSDRVTRLQEAGIVEGFTVDVNREYLRAGVPMFVQFDNAPEVVDTLRDRLAGADGVEHVFVTAEGKVWFYGRAEGANVRRWVESLLDDVPTTAYTVTLVDEAEWTPSLDGTEFAVTCVECGNTVDSEGESARIDDTVYHFCCPSCRSRFEERYQRLAEEA
ncbi:AsnC family transcriptional regulator [Haloplanus aerogenes]|uniref:AsnC family transcriptional regulator n=1 Tax=Haloplanus aerogenes TaxID=660522 RepID=A0A3M0DDG9_9EURY|nr:AsnC family transcriptional regulator [Haloplanus aerogenes]AZH26198.1 AsnC family transcriptional regulator [Haloplanus aerogenes]RMB18350.1 DNA-binding Lrp family transcriptional regulator [Haloplanus aerogenes]